MVHWFEPTRSNVPVRSPLVTTTALLLHGPSLPWERGNEQLKVRLPFSLHGRLFTRQQNTVDGTQLTCNDDAGTSPFPLPSTPPSSTCSGPRKRFSRYDRTLLCLPPSARDPGVHHPHCQRRVHTAVPPCPAATFCSPPISKTYYSTLAKTADLPGHAALHSQRTETQRWISATARARRAGMMSMKSRAAVLLRSSPYS